MRRAGLFLKADTMQKINHLVILMCGCVAGYCSGNALLSESARFYRTDEAKRIAANVLLYQCENGGWPKNADWKKELSVSDKQKRLEEKKRDEDATFDNSATHSEIRFLGKMYTATKNSRYKDAALKGVHFMLDAQYPNGGFAQFPCRTKGYYIQITFNDGAMVGVLDVLKQMDEGRLLRDVADEALRARCGTAVQKGIACILKAQIRVDGNPSLWCAQHDKDTLEPVMARSYELPSFSGAESVGIVRFLMSVERPSPDIVAAIEGAVAFFERLKLRGIRVTTKKLADGTTDRVVVNDPDAPPLWARLYDLKTLKPIFCSRDGIPREKLSDISFERRNGYSWLGYYAADLLKKDYPAWRKRVGLP